MEGEFPAAQGGSIEPGTYDLVRFEIHPTGGSDEDQLQRRFIFKGPTVRHILTDPGSPEKFEGGTYTTQGSDLLVMLTCPFNIEAALPYTVSGDELWLHEPDELSIRVYKRR